MSEFSSSTAHEVPSAEKSLPQLAHTAHLVNLIEDDSQRLQGMALADAKQRVLGARRGTGHEVLEIPGSFALVVQDREKVLMARSLDRPLRYFLAKQESGPMLVTADRIDHIERCLAELGYSDQFHPSYTRMVPAHHVTMLRLIGCPDPSPVHERFFDPQRETLDADLDVIGDAYVGALYAEVRAWLKAQSEAEKKEPIGVCFSGGIDSGAVLVALNRAMLDLGQPPQRLKAFTLRVDGGGGDAEQALEFLRRVDLEMLGEIIDVAPDRLDPLRAVEIIEDYKPLDVECASVAIALLEAIRGRYPEWKLLADGDGGDENLKDYPIEENSELTIQSVVNNKMLYQEGWGVGAMKHSLTYSGGLSRATVRTYAPLRHFGFEGFSPFTRPRVIGVAEAIPFRELTRGSHEALYALKGEVVRRGMLQRFGADFPVFEKRRFQHGAASPGTFGSRFDVAPEVYRRHYLARAPVHNRP